MKRTALFLSGFLFCACTASTRQEHSEMKFVPIFNGRDLDGWTPKIAGHKSGENYKSIFRVENGILKASYDSLTEFKGEFGHLFYKNKYTSYRLRAEYRFVGRQLMGGPAWALLNNGIMYHAQTPESMQLEQEFPVSMECQLLGSNDVIKRTTANLCTPGTEFTIGDSVVTDHCFNSSSPDYAGDQWVNLELIVYGDSIIHHVVNGDTVLTYTKPRIGGGFLPEGFPMSPGSALKEGYIAIQAESHPTEFRKIEVMDLSASTPDPDTR